MWGCDDRKPPSGLGKLIPPSSLFFFPKRFISRDRSFSCPPFKLTSRFEKVFVRAWPKGTVIKRRILAQRPRNMLPDRARQRFWMRVMNPLIWIAIELDAEALR